MTWWDELVLMVSSPSWMASVLSSLVGAALAFFGAVYLVFRQLRHDRELVTAQLNAMNVERIAQRRSVAAGRLGRVLVAAGAALDEYNVKGLLEQARTVEHPAGERLVYDAEDEARLVLDLDSTILDIWREMNHTWRECRTSVRQHDMAIRPSSPDYALSHAVEVAMSRPRIALDVLGRALIRWDGLGPVPSVDVLDGWSEIPVSDHAANAVWRKQVQEEFETQRQGIIARREASK